MRRYKNSTLPVLLSLSFQQSTPPQAGNLCSQRVIKVPLFGGVARSDGVGSPLWRGGAKRRGGLHKNKVSDHLPGSAGTPPTEENSKIPLQTLTVLGQPPFCPLYTETIKFTDIRPKFF